ncbi:MAG: aminotransferase class V-fold PLP-dependent enzyme, partial [Pseudomonadota bacterium]
ENFEQFFAGKAALGAAVRYALGIGMPAIEARTRTLAEDLRARLSAIPKVGVTDRGREKSGIVTFHKTDEPTDRLSARLRAGGLAHTVSPASYSRWDLGRRGFAEGVIRVSPHYFNSEDEIARCAALVAAG